MIKNTGRDFTDYVYSFKKRQFFTKMEFELPDGPVDTCLIELLMDTKLSQKFCPKNINKIKKKK